MRFLLAALFALSMPLATAPAQEAPIELVPRCGGPFQLCGYREKGTDRLLIPERFEVAQPFSEGLAAVRIDGQWGYIDATGKVVIPPRFKAAGPFSGNFAEVRVGNASGIIDRSGRVVVPAQFGRIVPFSNGTFIAEPVRGYTGQNAASAEGRLNGLGDPLALLGRTGAGLFHIRKGWLTEHDLNFDVFDVPERGLIWASRRNADGEDEWGLMRSDGAWQVTPRYHHVQRMMETHAIVESMPDRSLPPQQRQQALRRGAVDRDGKLVVPLKFAHLSYWRGGYGTALESKPYRPDGTPSNGREGIVRADGSLLGDRYFDKVDIPEDGMLPRVRLDQRWYSIEPSGRLVADQLDGMPLVECDGGLTIILRGEEVEFLRPQDRKPVGRFDSGYFQKRDCPGPFSAKRGNKWFFVLENGTVLGGRNGFDSTFSFTGSHVPVQVDGKWGIIDRTGVFTVEPHLAKLRPDRGGTYAVGEGPATYWIDASGNRVAKPAITRPTPDQALTCEGGLRFFQQEGSWGLRDSTGKTVIAPRFRALSCFQQGVSWTASPGVNAWCPIGPDGQRRAAMDCRKTYYPMMVTHHAPEKFSDDPFENSVLWTRAWLDYQAGVSIEPPRWIPDYGNGGTYSVSGGRASDVMTEPASAPGRIDPFATAILGSLFIGLGGHWWWERRRSDVKG